MRQVSEGIVLTQTKYGDTGLVVNIYTRNAGKQGFMVRMPRKAGGKLRPSYFFPLNQVEIVFEPARAGSELARLHEIRLAVCYRDIHADFRKASVACFLAEVMGKCISQADADTFFYDTVARALRDFDGRQQDFAEFHLFFLLCLAEFMGFYPQARQRASDQYFDLREGGFVSMRPPHGDFLENVPASDLDLLMRVRMQSPDGFPARTLFPLERRQALLRALADYCRIQAGIGADFRSMEVFRDVFEGA